MHTNMTQNERILAYMEKFVTINPKQAMNDLGIFRLASRITDLRRKGYPIISEWEEVKNRYGEKCRVKRYRLEGGRNNGRSPMDKDCHGHFRR